MLLTALITVPQGVFAKGPKNGGSDTGDGGTTTEIVAKHRIYRTFYANGSHQLCWNGDGEADKGKLNVGAELTSVTIHTDTAYAEIVVDFANDAPVSVSCWFFHSNYSSDWSNVGTFTTDANGDVTITVSGNLTAGSNFLTASASDSNVNITGFTNTFSPNSRGECFKDGNSSAHICQ
jgi:hypothetical protein